MTAPAPPTPSIARLALVITAAAIAIALAHAVDRTVFLRIDAPGAADNDWARALRITGYLPTWLVIAAALALIDSRRATFPPPLHDRWTRAATLALAPALAGLLAEGIKLVIRRERPALPDAAYIFRPFTESPWSTSGLGMPSSHTAVAFGAAYILTRLHPAAWPVWMGIAAGCGLTRILARAHATSDVIVGALTGLAAGAIVWALHLGFTRSRDRETAPC